MTLPVPVPRPSYSQARENLVKAIPPKIICLLACGGRDCRYEGPACWRPSQQAVRGVFSTWVTDSIVAMARPSTYLIKSYSIVEQFQQLKIKSLINMQMAGEHAHCGPALELESGFTYSPQIFMDNGIFFYNFGMPDFGVSSVAGMLDAVKVLAFGVKQGRVAVHCHAGLGRTGVLIACYLVYTLRLSPSEAIHFVRIKRPRSIQTQAQIDLVFAFALFLAPQRLQCPGPGGGHGAPFSLQQYLRRQRLLLHGQEARRLRHLPKIVHFLCGRLAALAWGRAPGPVEAELERGATVLKMAAAVRETLRTRRLLRGPGRPGNAPSAASSVSSWDDPEGFLERKEEVLRDRRSYSDSDLRKVALFQDRDFVPTASQALPEDLKLELRGNDQKLAGSGLDTPRKARCHGYSKTRGGPSSTVSQGVLTGNSAKRIKCSTRRDPAFPKSSSNVEISRLQSSSAPGLEPQAVAKAMAEQEPPGEDVSHRVARLQGELNSNECCWAILATEQDPSVLSCLLWTWLETLKEPVLSGEDVERITSGTPGLSGLRGLQKAQDRTVSCLLRCVGHVTSLCPQQEEAVLWRLVHALTQRSTDEATQFSALTQVFRAAARGLRCYGSSAGVVGNAAEMGESDR